LIRRLANSFLVLLVLQVPLWLCLTSVSPGLAQDHSATEGPQGANEVLGHPGYLIISSARDTTAGFSWQTGPGPQQLSLTWRSGMLTIPDTLVLEPFSLHDLAIPVTADFSAAGAGGQLEWREGKYDITEPLMMTDGVVDLLVSKGELEILATRIRYRSPELTQDEKADPRASFLMLAGVLLLIGVLMRRARRKMKENL